MAQQPASHLAVYTVRKGEGDKEYWIRLGAMFPHKDGAGWNIQLDAFPASGGGKLVALPPQQRGEAE